MPASQESQSYAIALVLLPPPHLAVVVDTLRSANDKACPRWSAHVTVLFPFGTVSGLPWIVDTLQSALSTFEPFRIQLDTVGQFSTGSYKTIFLGTSNPAPAQELWSTVVKAMSYPTKRKPFVPHMTLGQTARNPEAISFLTDKGSSLLEYHDFSWLVDCVTLLQKDEDDGGKMKVYAQIPLGSCVNIAPRYHNVAEPPTYYFDGERWGPREPKLRGAPISSLTVATYNILHDPAFPFISRLPHILDSILESNTDIICLQEVTDESVALLLKNDRIRGRWPWCTRYDQSVLESERNIVLLAQEHFSFKWVRLELGGKHKACNIARLWHQESRSEKSIVVAAVHLTAGRSSSILETKREEITKLLSHLGQHYAEDDWIIIGDFNCPSDEDLLPNDSSHLVDVWAGTMGADGATYDPTTNPLAAATARNCRTAERYDRAFIKQGSRLKIIPGGARLFGLPKPGGEVASDHWGLEVALHFSETPNLSPPICEPVSEAVASAATLLPIPTTFNDEQLAELCLEKGFWPSESQNHVFQGALDTLRTFVTTVSPHLPSPSTPSNDDANATPIAGVQLVIAPVGSFAMGYHTAISDIDCVVVGNITPPTFWSLMQFKIRTATPQLLKLRRFVKDAQVQMMELDVGGVKVDLQYCPAPKLVERWEDLPNIPRNSPLFSLSVSALRTLNAHRDTRALLQVLPSLDKFRLAHRSLKLFMQQRGIVGARFGFLGGFHTAFLLARICLQAPPTTTAAQLVQLFFDVYAHWDWENDVITVPIPDIDSEEMSYRRSKREPMVVLSIEKPQVNMTINANPNSVAVMRSVFREANRAHDAGMSWKAICGEVDAGSGVEPFERFVKSQKSFIKIDVSYWGSSCMKGRAWIGWLESRFVNLLVQLHENAPNVLAHLWPARLADASTVDHQTLNGFYLIGLSSLVTISGAEADIQSQRSVNHDIKKSILAALHSFEHDLRSNSRFYDKSDMYVCVTYVTAEQLPSSLALDVYQWPDGGYDEDEGDEEDVDIANVHKYTDTAPTSEISQNQHGTPSSHVPASKLRTSSDVYNRLMWDPAVSKEDYIIGYEDRFTGTKEVQLTAWKREVEDEAFIPFHRVVYFRRKSDSVKVWDRKTKTDLVFGSGAKC